MHRLILFSALLLTGCAQVKVIGPYRASLSEADVQSIAQIAQTIERRFYSRLTLYAIAPDEVYVWTVSQVHGGTMWYDYSAIRRGGTWRRGRYIPPPTE